MNNPWQKLIDSWSFAAPDPDGGVNYDDKYLIIEYRYGYYQTLKDEQAFADYCNRWQVEFTTAENYDVFDRNCKRMRMKLKATYEYKLGKYEDDNQQYIS